MFIYSPPVAGPGMQEGSGSKGQKQALNSIQTYVTGAVFEVDYVAGRSTCGEYVHTVSVELADCAQEPRNNTATATTSKKSAAKKATDSEFVG